MNQQSNTFSLTKEDKLKYLDQIKNFDLSRKKELMNTVPQKLNSFLQKGSLNSIQVQLVNDLIHLYKLLEDNPEMDEDIQKKVLFAMEYFSDVDDEIPDSIPVYGLLDDAAVINWIINGLKGVLQKTVRS
jgi:uncharacterized membrane protein YkvA (DUF1232 family)|tara:strand:+ start:166 stop:555 length:390 start_codon:yes stop_codon:yes gene_type:complete